VDWNRAIEKNREALRLVLASLVVTAACVGGGPCPAVSTAPSCAC